MLIDFLSLAIVPQGGNTGLVGGSVPIFDEVVVSTQLMNKIIDFDDVSGIVICQSGVILGNLETFLNERDHTVPLDLGAKGRYRKFITILILTHFKAVILEEMYQPMQEESDSCVTDLCMETF